MSSFADFALLAAVPSYGGAEILRAQRALPMGPGPRVHLALFGRNDAVTRRVVAAANAAAAVLHPAFARIYEISRFDGVVYGVGDPSEGADLSAVVALERQRRRAPPPEFAIAVVASLARVCVALHDAAGPGFSGGPKGIRSVLPGGLTPDVIFLDPSGAVRIRLLAGAGIDPNQPSAYLAPENQISMPADVHELGRLLMALLTGDASAQESPRLPGTSPLTQLLPRTIDANPANRPHLHELVMALEQLLPGFGVASPDQAVRAALAGLYKAQVVDPVLQMGAPTRIVDEVRMRLAYVYPAVERLWPSADGRAMPPPPPAMAALPPALSGEGAAVFTDARPAVRRPRAKTAATMLIPTAGLVSDLDADPAFKKPTKKTLLIPTADLLNALPAQGAVPQLDDADGEASPADRTKIIDVATFMPFAPPPGPPSIDDDGMPPPAGPPPVATAAPPPTLPIPDGDGDDETAQRPAEASSIADGVFASSDGSLQIPPMASPSAPTLARSSKAPPALVSTPDSAVDDDGLDSFQSFSAPSDVEADASTQMLTGEAGGIMDRLRIAEEQREARLAAKMPPGQGGGPAPSFDLPSFLDEPASTSLGPPPPHLSDASVANDAQRTTEARPRKSASAPSSKSSQSRRPTSRPVTPVVAPVVAPPAAKAEEGREGFEDVSAEFASSFAAAFGEVSATGTATDAGAALDPESDPELIEDAADFVLVGEAGQTFDGEENPFAQSTRVFHAQAMQAARSEDLSEAEEEPLDDDGDGDDDDENKNNFVDDVDDGDGSSADAPPLNTDAGVIASSKSSAKPSPFDEDDGEGQTLRGDGDSDPWASARQQQGGPTERSGEEIATDMVNAEAIESMLASDDDDDDDDFIADSGGLPSATGETSVGAPATVASDPVSALAPATLLGRSGLGRSGVPSLAVGSETQRGALRPSSVRFPSSPGEDPPTSPARTRSPQAVASSAPTDTSAGRRRPPLAPRTVSIPDAPAETNTNTNASANQTPAPRARADGSQARADGPRAGAVDAATVRTLLVVEADSEATVTLNGAVLGTGQIRVEIAPDARAVVRVTRAGHAPWSTVIQPKGKPRVRLRPTLKPLA